MAFDQPTRSRLARFVGDARTLLTDEFTRQLQNDYGLDPVRGEVSELSKLSHLDDSRRESARLLRATMDHYLATSTGKGAKARQEVLDRIVREQAYTVLNRLCALRMAEARGLLLESIARGYQSKGFQLYIRLAGTALGETGDAYRAYLFSLFDEFAIDLAVLFDRFSPQGRLFPRESTLLQLLEEINHPDLEPLWAEDETIGWIYQYFNSLEERRQMRAESQTPRNSRELAVRNQFFTPRYVVEFLTDNTLGRVWYEMMRGATRLTESCRYLVRRPKEVFLGHPNLTHDSAPDWVKSVLRGDFSVLPEHPEFDEIGALALLIDGFELAPAFGFGDVLEFGSKWMEGHVKQNASFPTDPLALWLILFAYQRAYLRDGTYGAEEDDPILRGIRTAYDSLRQALLYPSDDLSQDELLNQPVFVPQRAPKDPREIRMLDPACGSMHFGLYSFDLYEVIYEEAWEKRWVPAEEFGYRDEPTLRHDSVRLDPRQNPLSSYSGKAIPFDDAYVVMASRGDFGDGVSANVPYIVASTTRFRVPFAYRVKLSDFNYARELLAGTFDAQTGEQLLHSAGCFVFKEAPALSREEAYENFRRQIPRMIIEHNLHGIDIDPRAVQIAGLSLWLRAQKRWQVQGLKAQERPIVRRSNIVCAEPMPGDRAMLEEFLKGMHDERLESLIQRVIAVPANQRVRATPAMADALCDLVRTVWEEMELAGEAGSLLKIEEALVSAIVEAKHEWETRMPLFRVETFRVTEERVIEKPKVNYASRLPGDTVDFWERAEALVLAALEEYAAQAENGYTYSRRLFALDAAHGFAFIDLCRKQYDVVLMNPPFGGPAQASQVYIGGTYPSAKTDIYSCFVARFAAKLNQGFLGVISNRTGFFLAGMRAWRETSLFSDPFLRLLADLGDGVLDDALVETAAYVIANSKTSAIFIRLLDQQDKQSPLVVAVSQLRDAKLPRTCYLADIESFFNFPESRLSYWAPQSVRDIYSTYQGADGSDLEVKFGLSTKDDFRFLRLCWEVPASQIAARQDDANRVKPWMYIAKGGEYALHFADIHLVVNWAFKGSEIGARVVQLYPYLRGNTAWVLHPEVPYGEPGVTFTKRTTSGFSPRLLPPGCLISDLGCTIFSSLQSLLPSILAVYSSRAFSYLLEFNLASGDSVHSGSAARHYEIGTIASIPIPRVTEISDNIASAMLQIWRKKAEIDGRSETSRYFVSTAQEAQSGLIEIASLLQSRDLIRFVEILTMASKADQAMKLIYGFDAPALDAIASEFGPDVMSYSQECDQQVKDSIKKLWNKPISEIIGHASQVLGFSRFVSKMTYLADRKFELLCHSFHVHPSQIGDIISNLPPSKDVCRGLVESTISYLFGTTFGRWDIRYATGERQQPHLPGPFAPLPVCPPGMLQNAAGLPATPGDVSADYPLRITWPGIVVDDPGHPENIEARMREALQVIWGERAEVIEQEVCTILGVRTLRDYLAGPNSFFADHLSRYSKSRRVAPIYWPLSTFSGSYTLWLYYHRLTDQTLYRAVNDFVDPKRKGVAEQLGALLRKTGRSRDDERELERLATLDQELRDFRDELLRIAAFWKPNLNDGVQITAAPLYRLFQHRQWRKRLQETWEKLEAGDYDWAHLAYSIWPERVAAKCKTDKSLAIAHDLEQLYVELKNPAKQPKGRNRRTDNESAQPTAEQAELYDDED